MAIIEPQQMADKIIGQSIIGFAINFDTQTITLQLDNAEIDFEGDDLSMRVFDLEKPRLN